MSTLDQSRVRPPLGSVSKQGLAVVTVLVVAAFGPYVAGGVRTEQVVVYVGVAVVIALAGFVVVLPRALQLIVAVWGVYFAVVLIGAAVPPVSRSGFAASDRLAGIDNALLPLAVVLLTGGLVALGADAQRLLRRAAAVLVIMACANAVAALAQLQSGVEFTAWYGGVAGQDSVSGLAAQLGRYSGVVNQPAQAGVLYSLAGLCALYRFSDRPWLLSVTLTMVTVGGVLTVSKIFLLGGIPLLVIALLRLQKGRGARFGAVAIVAGGAGAASSAGMLPRWSGVDFLVRLLPGRSDENMVALFTANRYESGGGGTLASVTDAVLSGPWAFGFGGGGLAVPYDSGWVEALVVAGLFGVVAQVTVFVLTWRGWRSVPRSVERTLLGYVLVLLVGASLGLPALTANRVATVVWLLLSCLLFVCERSNRGAGGVLPDGPG